MVQKSETYADSLRLQNLQLQKQKTQLTDKIAVLDHEKKKQLLEIRTQLDFQRKKTIQFELKYKEQLKINQDNVHYKLISIQLTDQLNQKDNQIHQLKKKELQKKQKISELEQFILQLKNKQLSSRSEEQMQAIKIIIQQNTSLKDEVIQLRQGALNAIIQKDNIIYELQQKIKQAMEMAGGLQLIQLKQKYSQLQEKHEKYMKENEQIIYHKDNQIAQFKQRLQQFKIKSQERATRLEQDITQYEIYIQRLKQQKVNEDNLAESLDHMQEKNRKYQKRINQLQIEINDERNKKQLQTQSLKIKIEKQRMLQKQLQRQRNLKKQLENQKKQMTDQYNKTIKKAQNLEKQKQLLKNSLEDYKNYKVQLEDQKKQYNQILEEKLKIQASLQQIKQNFRTIKSQLIQQKQRSPKKLSDLQNISSLNQLQQSNQFQVEKDTLEAQLNSQKILQELSMSHSQTFTERAKLDDKMKELQLQKIKKDLKISQLEELIEDLEEQIETRTLDNKNLRLKILEHININSKKEAQHNEQIENLRNHLNKVENNLLILKLKNAQDEYYWKQRQRIDRSQFAKKQAKLNKQKAELYEKIDKLRKKGNQKKSQFYQSSLK